MNEIANVRLSLFAGFSSIVRNMAYFMVLERIVKENPAITVVVSMAEFTGYEYAGGQLFWKPLFDEPSGQWIGKNPTEQRKNTGK